MEYAMDNDNFWSVLENLVRILAGSREESEITLDKLEINARVLPKNKRDEVRNDLMAVIGQLARLATRLNEMDSVN